eukprot:TRINITY_DN3118_c0_g2_i1.p1 TRINITY_DN3118_c0_g2~~TRINITY_DN3118_c0_g2_i1.p1  ORF type:complete len:1005 (-),score=283.82 TRINITY_DN3118_c0_g2_i1:13-3027(-)
MKMKPTIDSRRGGLFFSFGFVFISVCFILGNVSVDALHDYSGVKDEYWQLCREGHQLAAEGRDSEAQKKFEEAIAIHPKISNAWTHIGNIYFRTYDHQKYFDYYKKAEELESDSGVIKYNLGIALSRLGKHNEAQKYFREAITCDDIKNVHKSVAGIQRALGNHKEAVKAFEREIEQHPSYITMVETARSCIDADDPEAAVRWAKRAIEFRKAKDEEEKKKKKATKDQRLKRRSTEEDEYEDEDEEVKEIMGIDMTAEVLLAMAMSKLDGASEDRLTEAIVILEPLLKAAEEEEAIMDAEEKGLTPPKRKVPKVKRECLADALSIYGDLKKQLVGNFEVTINANIRGARLNPICAHCYNNLAVALLQLGRRKEAEELFNKALKLHGGNSHVYSNMAGVYTDREDTAVLDLLKKATRRDPKNSKHWTALADSYSTLKMWKESEAAFKQALYLKPNDVRSTIGLLRCFQYLLNWSKFKDRVAEAMIVLDEAHQNIKHIVSSYNLSNSEAPRSDPDHDQVFHCFNAMEYGLPPPYILKAAETSVASTIQSVRLMTKTWPLFDHTVISDIDSNRPRRIRVGYVFSPHSHPVTKLICAVFKYHDRSRFEVFAFSLESSSSPITDIVKSGAEHYVVLEGMGTVEKAKYVNDFGIDILINCDGWAKGGEMKLFALKPAPIAINLMGTITTLGSPFVDYMATDQLATPLNTESWYSEKFLYLPNSFFVTSYKETLPDLPTSPIISTKEVMFGVPFQESSVLYACLGRLGKITEPYFDVFMNILKRVPSSYLWLLEYPEAAVESVFKHAAARGIGRERFIITPIIAESIMHLRALADISLDTEFNGFTTRAEMLWLGVPTISIAGPALHNRGGITLVNATCGDYCTNLMIVHSLEEYEERAVQLGTDLHLLSQLRTAVETSRLNCPLFDTKRWVANFEIGLRKVLERRYLGLPPDHTYVSEGEPWTPFVPAKIRRQKNSKRTRIEPEIDKAKTEGVPPDEKKEERRDVISGER